MYSEWISTIFAFDNSEIMSGIKEVNMKLCLSQINYGDEQTNDSYIVSNHSVVNETCESKLQVLKMFSSIA